jgi:hypothetical protein
MEMARRKQRADKGKGETSSDIIPRSGLEDAWSSSPTKPPRYVLYCYNHESERQYIVNSYGLYAIRKIFDALTEGQEIEPSPLDPDHTMTFGNIDIKSDQMQQILDHQYSKTEEEWQLPVPYPNDISAFLHGARMRTDVSDPDAPKPVKESRAPKESKVDRSQFITVQQLAEEAKIDPRDARAALRKAKVEKPSGGWLGDEAWAKGIREILAKAAKDLAKKGKK